jgi:membrane-bound lytic murein transglycosylase A
MFISRFITIISVWCAALSGHHCQEVPAAKVADPLPPHRVEKRKLSSAMIPAKPDTLPYIPYDPAMVQAMYEQGRYLRRSDVKKYPVTGISKKEMLETVTTLQDCQLMYPDALLELFDFYRINTDLKSDKVRVTGYYTPIIKASHKRGGAYQHPMLARPKDYVPNPAAIAAGALEGKGLELAWVRTKRELENAQLQGSCLVEFQNGKREFLGFGGSVKGAGGTYVFFTKVGDRVLGSGFFPLTGGYSAAIDPRFIPVGATLLAELPDIDRAGKLKGYTYRIIFAQDRGGAIQTTKRIDLYCGIGKKALEEAKRINRYGRLWLMLPKKS